MAKRPATAKALIKELEGHINASKAQLSVKFGDATMPLYLPNAGIVNGDDYGAMLIDGKAYLLELDGKGVNKSVKVIENPDATKLAAIVKQLLPEPEESAEVKAAREALESFVAPKGYKLVLDSKGRPALVESDAPIRTPRGESPPKAPMPEITVGLRLTEVRSNKVYAVTGIDRGTGYVILKPEDGGEDTRKKLLKGDGTTKTVPVVWRNWQPAE